VGPISLLGVTRTGTLYYSESASVRQNLFLADLADLRATNTPVAATERMVDANLGSTWSRNGEYIAYYSFRQVSADMQRGVLVTRSTRTGEERTVPLPTRVVSRFGAGPKWFPDNRSVLVESGNAQGTGFAFYRMAIDTGNVELLTSLPRDVSSYDLSPDGKVIYYALGYGEIQQLMRFDVETKQATEVRSVVSPEGREVVALAISPDGTRLAATLIGGFVEVMPASGGPSRLVFSPSTPELGTGAMRQGLAWSPDQRNLVFVRGDASLWKVPAAGGEAEKVGLERVKSPAFSPDGRRLVFVSPDPPGARIPASRRVMLLENFLPEVSATR
jgi:Tol biopolymer transport system component